MFTFLACLYLLITIDFIESYTLHTGLKSLADRFDYFIVDQWGVLHDGKKAYEGTIEALQNLK
jgi:hypothetical protein